MSWESTVFTDQLLNRGARERLGGLIPAKLAACGLLTLPIF